MGQGQKGSPVEYPVTLFLNCQELVTIQLTPVDLEDWTVGFLFGEGIISEPGDIEEIVIDETLGHVWAVVGKEVADKPMKEQKRYVTSGCGKGVTFSSVDDAYSLPPVIPGLSVTQEFLVDCMRSMYKEAVLYQETGGMHAALLATAEGAAIVREDIGRHNAVDKVIGAALKMSFDPSKVLLMTTGRISYEMVSKVAKFGASMVASRTAATDQAVRLASNLGVEVVGYIRGQMMQVYTNENRVIQTEKVI